jgi:hypothetical protein
LSGFKGHDASCGEVVMGLPGAAGSCERRVSIKFSVLLLPEIAPMITASHRRGPFERDPETD